MDVAENRFVKAFLDQATGIVDAMREVAESRPLGFFERRLLADCDAIDRELAPIARHRFWDDISEMRRLPAESQVLQRRRGYRDIFRHFVRLRMTARLPLGSSATLRVLEVKDIAELYELWCFFEIERQVTRALGKRPTEASVATSDELAVRLGWGARVAWDDRTELFYNLSYSRSRSDARRSYSLPLRPDIVLRLPDGPNAGDHIFDAKFKVRRIDDAVQNSENVDDGEQADERRGVFKHADLYKMHAYRDAIPRARTAWILFPGSEFRFFDEARGVESDATVLAGAVYGVGAIPLQPDVSAEAAAVLACLLRPA